MHNMKNYCECEYIWKKYTKIVKILRMIFFKGSNYGFTIVPGSFRMICNNIYYFYHQKKRFILQGKLINKLF